MKRLIALSMLFCLTFCGDKNTPSNIRAKVMIWGNSGIEYTVADFKYLTDARHVDGVIAAVRGGSIIDAGVSTADVISGDPDKIFTKKGSQVQIDYDVENGVIVSKNFDSLAMLSLYHSYEQIVDFWVNQYDFTLKEIGKFNIHYDPGIAARADSFKLTVTQRLNAAYFNGLGDFLMFKTSRLEDVPIKMNPGVLAHEFGHKVFDIRFANRSPAFTDSTSAKASNQLSGINEGFADFVSWLFTQDKGVYTQSLDVRVFQDRVLPVAWTSSKLAAKPSICTGGFYCKGSILTSALYELAIDPSMTPQKVGTATLAALPQFRADWANHGNDSKFDYYYLLNRIVAQLPANEQPLACSIFNTWFDDDTNKNGLKQACP